MIAFASCVGSPEKFREYAEPGLRLACESDSLVAEVTTDTSIFEAYNEVLDAFSERDGLEALVLLHEDVEIVDHDFCAKVRARFADPDVAVMGVVGARDIKGLAWWDAEGYGRCLESRGLVDFGGGFHDVDVVDGVLMVLSPWAVRNLRFDSERFRGFHAYDLDFCLQARAAGKRVVVDEIGIMHYPKGTLGDSEAFRRNDAALVEKWDLAAREPAASLS
jgi:GT2 family glycosyltransferase